MSTAIKEWQDFCYKRHDIDCNQKYGDLPYSFHLKSVEAQGNKFIHLVREGMVVNKDNQNSLMISYKDIVRHSLVGHDLIEDARVTYNNVLKKVNTEKLGNYKAAVMITDIIHCVTDEKGRNRKERKNEKYYEELKQNKLAIFVKLADIAANRLYSKLTGSSMYNKYVLEFQNVKKHLFVQEYDELFKYINNI